MDDMKKPMGRPQIRMKRTGSSRPLANPGKPEKAKSSDDKVLILDSPRVLKSWTEQTERMARGMGCLDVLGTRQSVPRRVSPKLESEWMRKLRIVTAQHIVLSRITPAVFAYMRVLGYNDICGRNATETYDYAKRAAGRIHVPHNAGKEGIRPDHCPGEEEDIRMVWEWKFSKKESYPEQISYHQSMAWLGEMLRRRAEVSEVVRELLDTFEQQDTRFNNNVPPTDLDVSGKSAGKRRDRDEEPEPLGADLSPYLTSERQTKKLRLTPAEDGGAAASRARPLQATATQPSVDRPGSFSTQTRPPHPPDTDTTSPNIRPQLGIHTVALPEKPNVAFVSALEELAISQKRHLDTGLLTPQDLKDDTPELEEIFHSKRRNRYPEPSKDLGHGSYRGHMRP